MSDVLLSVGRRDEVGVYRRTGDGWEYTAAGVRGRWPVWSPDRTRYAVSVVNPEQGTSRIEVRSAAHEVLAVPFESLPGEPAGIAPRVPHYVSWSPDGRYLGYVVPTPTGLQQFVAGQQGLGDPRSVASGAPLFSAWDPKSRYLALHAAATALIVDLETLEVREDSPEAIGYRAPGFSSDGELVAYGTRSPAGLDLQVGPPDSVGRTIAARYEGGVVIALRPGTHVLTAASASNPESGVFDALETVDIENGRRARLWRGPYVAFSWAPAGDRVVIVVPTQSGDGRYALYALSPEGTFIGATDGFVPSEDTRTALGFFDQYFPSHSPWSGDGSQFVVSGRLPTDAVSSSMGDPVGDYVFSWRPERGSPLTMVGPGGFAAWPPVVGMP